MGRVLHGPTSEGDSCCVLSPTPNPHQAHTTMLRMELEANGQTIPGVDKNKIYKMHGAFCGQYVLDPLGEGVGGIAGVCQQSFKFFINCCSPKNIFIYLE